MDKLKIFWGIIMCLAVVIQIPLVESTDDELCSEIQDIVTRGIEELSNQDCGRFGSAKIKKREISPMSRPWMALLLSEESKLPYICTGTLIHKRFVLTAAHCFSSYNITSVRLGEHDRSTATDCRQIRGQNVCTPPVVDVAPEKVYVHKQFPMETVLYDIALIKLAKDVEFSESISPICLPLTEELQKEYSLTYFLTGWGTNTKLTENIVLHVNQTDCAKIFHQVTSQQLCSTGSDLCEGSAGSPLSGVSVFNDAPRIIQFGIVSYGGSHCEITDPLVSTNVSSFIRWIAFQVAKGYA